MPKQQAKGLIARFDSEFTDAELEKMLSIKWPKIQYSAPRIIATTGDRSWVSQRIQLVGGSVVKLYDYDGTIDAGTAYGGRAVDCRGYYNGSILDGVANQDCPVPGMNKLCFVVGIGNGKLPLRNPAVGPGGASVGDRSISWHIGQAEAGEIFVAFNDSNSFDNHGYMTQLIEGYSPSKFAETQLAKRHGEWDYVIPK